MHKTFVAALVAASVTLTGFTATPARASDQEFFNIVVGATALYFIGKAISDANQQPGVTRNPPPPPPRKVLPARCQRQIHTQRGWKIAYGERCTRRFVNRPRLLPSECLARRWTPNGWRNVFRKRCMKRHGWTV